MSSRRASRFTLVLFLLLPLTLLLTPTLTAQGNPDPPWNPVQVFTPAMNYQPPVDADNLNDFLPPGYTYVNATTVPTPTIRPTGTLPHPTATVSIPGGSPTSPAGVTPVLPTETTPPITPTMPTPVSPPTGTVTPPNAPGGTVVTLPESGAGALFNNQEVALIVEDATFNLPANIQFTPLAVPTYPLTATGTISNPAQTRTLLSFQIEASNSSTGQAIPTFEHPVRLVVDLRELTEGLNPVYTDFWLAYRDPSDPNVWREVPITVHQPDGLISAEVTHFSEWASGVRPERWNPSWNPPAVSEFSGAATYSYPIDVPEGRNGLQPSVALSYSSRGIDGRIRDGEQGVVADGWSLAEINISRVDVRMEKVGDVPYTHLQHRFRLVLNGTGYELVAGGTGQWNGTRFYATNAPDLYVELHDITVANSSRQRLYWSIVTGDGTYYRLGYQDYAEESQQVPNASYMALEGSSPVSNPTRAGIAWHVDLVVDPFGNRMTYTYYTRTLQETIDYYVYATSTWYNYILTTYINRIENINYNYTGQTTSLPPSPSTPYPTGTPGSRIGFRARWENQWWNATDPVTNIFVYHGSLSTPIKEYRIETEGLQVESPTCENEDVVPEIPRVTTTRVVTEIRLFVGTNNDPDDNDAGYALPPVTFDYDYKPHYLEQGQYCFNFYYLTEYQNGYGGEVTFTYTSDNRQVGEYTTPNDSCFPMPCELTPYSYEWPEIGYNYFVTTMTQNDGINANTSVTYSYDTPCYQQASATAVGSLNGAHRCDMPYGEWNYLPEAGNLMGFEETTVTYKGFSSENLTRRITTFSQDHHHMGQVDQSESYIWSGSQFQRVSKADNTLSVESVPPVYFSYVSQSESYQYDPSDNNRFLATKQVNQYSTTYQGGQQWGRLTQQELYYWANSQWVFHHKQVNRYRTRTTNSYWRILPYSQGIYDNAGTAKQLSLFYYDYATNNPDTQTISQGRLTLSRSVLVNTPIPGYSTRWYSSDTQMTYDSYGNPTAIKANTAKGEVGLNGSAWSYSVLPGSSTEQSTTIGYDGTYHLYPLTVTQEGASGTGDDLTITFQVYGFNGVSLDGWQKQTGLLKQVTNPNGLLTIYEYDPFGRLAATYENATDRGTVAQYLDGDPLARYRYWDNGWNQAILQGGQLIPVVYLDPANDDPFMITTQTRPGSFNTTTPGYEFRTQTFFDGLGRVIQEQNTYQEVHDPDAGLLQQKDVVTSTQYNAQGLATCQTVPYTVALYNQRATFPDNPYVTGSCTSYSYTATTYDKLGRPLTVTSPGGQVSTYAYGVATGITSYGHDRLSITRVQDANNHLVRQYQNVLGQLVLVKEYTGAYPNESEYADTRYKYGILGNLTEVGTSAPNNSQPSTWLRLTQMSYDAQGHKLTMTDPDMGDWSYTYDALGNMTSQTDAEGQTLCFWVDRFNRPTDKRYDANQNGCDSSDTLRSQTSYYAPGNGAATGQVQQVLWPDTSNRDSFSYNTKGQLSSHSRVVDGSSYTMAYSNYDKLNRPQTLTYPNSESVALTYDHEGEKSIAAGGTTLVSDIWYNKVGQRTEVFRGNNVRTTYDYAAASGDFRLENAYTRRFVYPFTTDLLDFDYTYDSVGNVTHIFEDVSNDSQWFGYDELNRLTSAYTTGGPAAYNHTYTYDVLGNLQSRNETVSGATTVYDLVYTISAQDQPDAVDEVKIPGKAGNPDTPIYDLTYDDNGNMTGRVDHLASKTYTQGFDEENRLTTVTLSSGAPMTTTFRYDASGQRTQTIAYSSSTSRTITDYPFPNYEVERAQSWQYSCGIDPCGYIWVTTQTTTRSTYFMAGQAIATRVNGTLYFLQSDHLGSTSLMTNTSGYSVSGTTARYLPYGGYRTTPTAGLTEMGYTGHHQNDSIGLIYMNARFFVPSLGRFASADTIVPSPGNPQSYNRYTYTRNNPIMLVDPSGHADIACPDICPDVPGGPGPETPDACVIHPAQCTGSSGGNTQQSQSGGSALPQQSSAMPICMSNNPLCTPNPMLSQLEEWEIKLIILVAYYETLGLGGQGSDQYEAILYMIINLYLAKYADLGVGQLVLGSTTYSVTAGLFAQWSRDTYSDEEIANLAWNHYAIEGGTYYGASLDPTGLEVGIARSVIALYGRGGNDPTNGGLYFGHLGSRQLAQDYADRFDALAISQGITNHSTGVIAPNNPLVEYTAYGPRWLVYSNYYPPCRVEGNGDCKGD